MSDTNSGEFIRLQTALSGRYFLEREVGRGGMGVVYLARDVALDRPVALKLLPPRLASVPALRQRFLSEARTAAKLSHPNIVPIFAVEEAGDYVFFVMAFVDGETLGQRIRARGPMPPTELTTLLREISWGLAYAHGQGIVHRDVKADNILLEAGSNRALIADFGIARVAEASGTNPNEILGTAEYMSPEQASGEHVDHRSDIYSLGIVAFYALSGQLPFEGHSTAAVLAKQITQPAPPIAEVSEGVPSRLARAVDRCLAKDRSARFDQASDLADALALALEARREAPMAIKVFIRKLRELKPTIGLEAALQAFIIPALIIVPDWQSFYLILGTDVTLLFLPIVNLLWQLRKLMRAGYDRADAALAFKADLEREAEERFFELGRRTPMHEWVMRGTAVVGAPVAFLAVRAFLRSLDVAYVGQTSTVRLIVGFVTAAVAAGAGLWAFAQHERRTDWGGHLLKRFLDSDFMRSCADVARSGLRRVHLIAPPTHRPTEMAIGMAVESLFAALPKDTKRELGDLPAVVAKLEGDATKMRQRVEEMNDMVAKIEAGRGRTAPTDQITAQRDKMDRDVQEAREVARTRLADAVAALEGIRLNLLRLTAGTGSVEGLTTDLANAKDVSEEVGRLLAAHGEIEADLRGVISPVPGS
jgi:serine/threonine-protein kinase